MPIKLPPTKPPAKAAPVKQEIKVEAKASVPAGIKVVGKKPSAAGNTTAAVLSKLQKDYGETAGSYGGSLEVRERLPSGIFPLDLAMGGGFPRGRCSIVYGPESSGKTNLILRLIAVHQRWFPDLTCVFFDVEFSWDPEWARAMGVDTDRVIVIPPTHAEQLVDMAEGFLSAEDCGIVVVDSLAAMMTGNEADSSAEKANVGGASNPVGKLVRRTTFALGEAEAAGRKPTLIYVNQIRHKIGVMFGDPETTPGGNAPKFQSSMTLRLYGKNVKDPKVSAAMPVGKSINFVLKKWKVPILAASGTYEQIMVPHDGFAVGECDDYKTVSTYLEQLGQFSKAAKGGWDVLGQHYKTAKEFESRLYGEPAFGNEVRQGIIKRLLQEGKILTAEAS